MTEEQKRKLEKIGKEIMSVEKLKKELLKKGIDKEIMSVEKLKKEIFKRLAVITKELEEIVIEHNKMYEMEEKPGEDTTDVPTNNLE